MHETAMEIGRRFFETYLKNGKGLKIVEIGSQDVNGSLRSVAPPDNEYIGIDFAPGKGVDVVINDPYALPLPDNCADVVVSSSCFEHSEFFWLVFNEIQRILKPSGLFYFNSPSDGFFHRYPVDCWRFYPDSGMALQNWARRSGFNTALVESFTGTPLKKEDFWSDFVAVFIKDPAFIGQYPERILDTWPDHVNGLTYENKDFSKFSATNTTPKKSRKARIFGFLRR
jgi:SAM-dependent methyltransferase